MNIINTISGMNRKDVEMRLLLRDFFSRYWRVVLISMAYTIIIIMGGKFGSVGFLFVTGAVLVSWERMRGVYGVYRTLPIPRTTIHQSIWLEGVILVPLIYAVWCPLTLLAASAFTESPVFTGQNAPLSIAFTITVGVGYAAILMLLLPSLPRPGVPEDYWRLSKILASGLWGLLCGGVFFLPVLLTKGFTLSETWSFAVLAAAPVLVALSYFRTVRIVAPERAGQTKRAVEVQPSYPRSWLDAGFGFWAPQVVMALSCFFVLVAMVGVAFVLLRGENAAINAALSMAIFVMVIFAPITATVWFISLRALRALPMTSLRLTLFLFAFPTVSAIVVTLYMVFLFTIMGEPGMVRSCLTAGLTAFGFGCALCTAFARFGLNVIMLFVPAMMFMVILYPHRMAPFWLIAALAAFFFLWHTIKSSSSAYQLKLFNNNTR